MNTMFNPKSIALRCLAIGLTTFAFACGDDDDPMVGPEDMEVITTVNLTFNDGTNMITAQWADQDGDGGNAPVITAPSMAFTVGSTYAVSVEILNETEDPAEDVTEEIEAEAEEHQFFYVVSSTIATVAITDVESDYTTNQTGDDLPVGLAADFVVNAAGSGTLNVVLKHLPPINGMVQKTGTNTINDGESDFDITFNFTAE